MQMITQHVDLDKHHTGMLSVLEFKGLPFVPRRIFWVTNVPKGEERGNHAHYLAEQVLVCVQGMILVRTDDGKLKLEHILKSGDYIYIGRMVWDSQIFLTDNDVLMVLTSTSYDKKDYIEDKEMFYAERRK